MQPTTERLKVFCIFTGRSELSEQRGSHSNAIPAAAAINKLEPGLSEDGIIYLKKKAQKEMMSCRI